MGWYFLTLNHIVTPFPTPHPPPTQKKKKLLIPNPQLNHQKKSSSKAIASLRLFNENYQFMVHQANKWEKAVNCDWVESRPNFETTITAIAKECNFIFIPTLLPLFSATPQPRLLQIPSSTFYLNEFYRFSNSLTPGSPVIEDGSPSDDYLSTLGATTLLK